MIAAALVVALLAQVAQPAVQAPDEEAVREAVRAYYEVQTKKDPDKAAAFWSAAANPRMSREAFVAMFGAGEAEYTADVQSVTIKGTDARVRVSVTIARTIVRNDVPTIARMTQLFSQVWRKEGAGWKLLREGTVADEIADDLIAATPAERPALYETHRQYLTQARLAISQRATMACCSSGRRRERAASYRSSASVPMTYSTGEGSGLGCELSSGLPAGRLCTRRASSRNRFIRACRR